MRLVVVVAEVAALCGALILPAAAEDASQAPQSVQVTPVWSVQGFVSTQRFRDPLSLTCDPSTGEIFVADTGNHDVAIFDAQGAPVFRFTHYLENGEPGGPRCALQTSDGHILVTDAYSDKITVTNARGEVQKRLDTASLAGHPGRHVVPGYIARDRQGLLYVTVSGDVAGVLVLDDTLSAVRFFNGQSPAAGELTSPTGVAVGDDGRVIVTDPGAALAVSFFSPEGEFLGGFGRHESGRDDFSFPSGVSSLDGLLWVPDTVRQVVKGMDAGGHLATMLGGKGVRPGDMLFPTSVASDGSRRLYVLERVGARFQAFEIGEKIATTF